MQKEDKNTAFTFYVFGPPLESVSRPLTDGERSYLFGRNIMRLLQLLGFFFWVLFIALFVFGFVFSGVYLMVENTMPWLGLFFLVLGFILVFFYWKSWGAGILHALRVSWWLPVKEATPVSLRGHFGIQLHPTMDNDNLWTVNDALVDFPAHWSKSIDKMVPDVNTPQIVDFRVAKFTGATGLVARLPMRSKSGTSRLDVIFSDPKYVVLNAPPRSVKEDKTKKIPIHRNNPYVVILGLSAIIISVFVAVVWDITLDKENDTVLKNKNELEKSISALGLERPIALEELKDRDFPGVHTNDTFGSKMLESDSISFVRVASRNDVAKRPFVLSVNEYHLITRLSTVSPRVLFGYNSTPDSKDIETYRTQLLQRIAKSADVPETVRAHQTAKIQAMDAQLIEAQMRSYGDRFRADNNFTTALLPLPMVYVSEYSSGSMPFCVGEAVFCGFNPGRIQVEKQVRPIFTVLEQEITLQTIGKLTGYKEKS